jgi:hypothetical protein
MVLNSHHSLTASTTLASVVSAGVLTAVGLCIPYTERAAKHRAPLPGIGALQTAEPAAPGRMPGRASAGSSTRLGAADAAQH